MDLVGLEGGDSGCSPPGRTAESVLTAQMQRTLIVGLKWGPLLVAGRTPLKSDDLVWSSTRIDKVDKVRY
jgi:hypothetical protein